MAPVLTSFTTPATAQGHGGTVVTVAGTGLLGTAKVNFGTKSVTPTATTSTSVSCVAPSGCAGQTSISVVTGGVTSNSLSFFYLATPTISSLSANLGPASPPALDVFGTGLSTATQVTFAGAAPVAVAPANIVSDTQLTNITPPTHTTFTACVDTVNVTATALGGTSTPSGPANQFDYYDLPTVASVSPATGIPGTQGVIVSGTCYSGLIDVTFTPVGGGAAVSGDNVAPTGLGSLTVDVPATLTPGVTYDITVITPGGTSAINANDQFAVV